MYPPRSTGSLLSDLLYDYLLLKMLQISQSVASNRPRTKAAHELEVLLDYIKRSRGFDFSGYKRPSLMRRVLKRMQMVGIDSYSDYIYYLKQYPEEYTHLFNTLLINCTSFFRDRVVWDYLSKEIIPQIVAGKAAKEPIRVWSAGCASGEEAYSLAIILAEALGVEQFQERVKIYATDIDEEALNEARQGSYTAMQVAGISRTLLDKYCDRIGDRYIFNQDLCSSLIFARHNLIEDAPISGIDILMCRNILMYFNTETQISILSRFNLAVQDSGFLVVGEPEGLHNKTDKFTVVDTKLRIYSKLPAINRHSGAASRQDLEAVSIRQMEECASEDINRPILGEPPSRSVSQAGNIERVKPLKVSDRSKLELEIDMVQCLIHKEELTTLKQERLILRHELETTHEELKATNEELRSMNQELQLLTEELHQRNNEVNRLKALVEQLSSILPITA